MKHALCNHALCLSLDFDNQGNNMHVEYLAIDMISMGYIRVYSELGSKSSISMGYISIYFECRMHN